MLLKNNRRKVMAIKFELIKEAKDCKARLGKLYHTPWSGGNPNFYASRYKGNC